MRLYAVIYVPRLEMFARTRTTGWCVSGSEVSGAIDITSQRSLALTADADDEPERK